MAMEKNADDVTDSERVMNDFSPQVLNQLAMIRSANAEEAREAIAQETAREWKRVRESVRASMVEDEETARAIAKKAKNKDFEADDQSTAMRAAEWNFPRTMKEIHAMETAERAESKTRSLAGQRVAMETSRGKRLVRWFVAKRNDGKRNAHPETIGVEDMKIFGIDMDEFPLYGLPKELVSMRFPVMNVTIDSGVVKVGGNDGSIHVIGTIGADTIEVRHLLSFEMLAIRHAAKDKKSINLA